MLGDTDSDIEGLTLSATDGESENEYGDALAGLIEDGVLKAELWGKEIDLDMALDRRFVTVSITFL